MNIKDKDTTLKNKIETYQLLELYKKGYFPMAENSSTDEIDFYILC